MKKFTKEELSRFRRWFLARPGKRTSCDYEMGDSDHQLEEELCNVPDGYYEWLDGLSEKKRSTLDEVKSLRIRNDQKLEEARQFHSFGVDW